VNPGNQDVRHFGVYNRETRTTRARKPIVLSRTRKLPAVSQS
jgi:hypothetical protein